jgi:diacylglycerol kinase (CTP)
MLLSTRSDLNYKRIIWHISWGMVGLGIFYFISHQQIWYSLGLIFLSLAGFYLDFIRLKDERVNVLFLQFFSRFMRQGEIKSFSGFPFYTLGVGLALLLFSREVAILSISYLVFADPLASFVGLKWGVKKYLPHKSVAGSITFFGISYLITLFCVFLWKETSVTGIQIVIFSLLSALAATFSESLSTFNIDDNLTIPVLSGLMITILNYFYKVMSF